MNQFDKALKLAVEGFPESCRGEPRSLRILVEALDRCLDAKDRDGYITTMEQIAWRAKVWSTLEAKAEADECVGG